MPRLEGFSGRPERLLMRLAPRIIILAICLAAPSSLLAKKTETLRGEVGFKVHNEKILKPLWSRSLKSGSPAKRYTPEAAQPILHDGVIYVGTHAGRFYAVNADTGKILWQNKMREPIATPAAIKDGRVYFTDIGGRVNALSADSGRRIWRQVFDREMLGTPLIADGKVYLIRGETTLMALSADDGHVVWEREIRTFVKDLTMRGQAGLIQVGTKLLAGLADGRLYAFATTDGDVLWSQDLALPMKTFKDIDVAIAQDGDAMYVGGYSGRFYRLRVADGKPVWKAELATGLKPAILADKIIVSDNSGQVIALDKIHGRQLWFNELNGAVLSEPAEVLGRIFVATHDHHAFLLSADTGAQLQKLNLGAGSIVRPVVDGSRVFVFTHNGRLLAFGPK